MVNQLHILVVGILTSVKTMYLPFTGHLSLLCFSANHLNRLDSFLDSVLFLLPQQRRNLYHFLKKKSKYLKKHCLKEEKKCQRWKTATRFRHKAPLGLSRGLTPPSTTFPRYLNQLNEPCSTPFLPEDGTLDEEMASEGRPSVTFCVLMVNYSCDGHGRQKEGWMVGVGGCRDSCKYVFSFRYCHTGIADLQ